MYLKSVLPLCPAGQPNFVFAFKVITLQRSDRPEQARAQRDIATDVVTAVVRTIRSAIRSRAVVVVERPKRRHGNAATPHESAIAQPITAIHPIPDFGREFLRPHRGRNFFLTTLPVGQRGGPIVFHTMAHCVSRISCHGPWSNIIARPTRTSPRAARQCHGRGHRSSTDKPKRKAQPS